MWRHLLALTLVGAAEGLYFHVREGERRCFVEEVPDDEIVVGAYTFPEFGKAGEKTKDEHEPTGIDITVQNPAGNIIMTTHAEDKGRFSFHSEKGGEYMVCLMTNSSNYYGYGEHRLLKFYLKMDIGQSSSDYEKVAKKEHLGSLGLELRKLNDRVKSILKEQHYMRENEAAFRDTSETCNAHVAYWSLGQTAILLVSGVWQIMHLKRFFEAKKLV